MRLPIISCILVIILHVSVYSQELLIKPPYASQIEPRIGFIFQNNENLRLDIGTSLDLYKKEFKHDKLAFGIDFFTFTRLRSEGKFKFPVETSDYFFGINSSYQSQLFGKSLSIRTRIAHISSHLVDGFADSLTFRKLPFVYSREFIDIVGFLDFDYIRVYGGSMILFSTIPKVFSVFNPQIGFDFNHPISKLIEIEIGSDFKLQEIENKWREQISIQTGITFRTFEKMGITLFGNYFKGSNIHGMFFNENDEYFALGIQAVYF